MTAALLGLALALALGETQPADACATVAAVDEDVVAAGAYRAVGDAELARGNREAAVVAYRAAAARDPSDAASRAALARLCEQGAPVDPFADGVARLDAGDPRGALRALRAARGATPPSSAGALLEGICHYDVGEDAEAERLLRVAELAPAHRDAARLYLGLVRLRAGDASEAAALFDAAREGPALRRVAGDLGRLARREGPLVLSVLAESGWDSNVTLAARDAAPGPASDGAVGLSAAALWRPRGPSGPFVRATAGLTEQLSLGTYDFATADGAVGWQQRVRALTVAAEYDLGTRTLGGERYLTAHRLLASAVVVRRGTALAATYAARFEDYAWPYGDYSGVVHRGELRLSHPLGDTVRVAVVYGVARDLARTADLSFVEHGPRAELRVALGPRARILLDVGPLFRAYDEADANLGVLRRDVRLDGAAAAELDLGAHLTARVALLGRRVWSTAGTLEYEKLAPSFGLLWVSGL